MHLYSFCIPSNIMLATIFKWHIESDVFKNTSQQGEEGYKFEARLIVTAKNIEDSNTALDFSVYLIVPDNKTQIKLNLVEDGYYDEMEPGGQEQFSLKFKNHWALEICRAHLEPVL